MKKVYQTSKSQTMKETKNKNKRESVQEPLFATNYTTAAIQIGRQIKHQVNDYDTDEG